MAKTEKKVEYKIRYHWRRLNEKSRDKLGDLGEDTIFFVKNDREAADSFRSWKKEYQRLFWKPILVKVETRVRETILL